MKIGIVGAERAKFSQAGERAAREAIRKLLTERMASALFASTPEFERPVVVSGGCHLGGVDIWAEEIARELGLLTLIHLPKQRSWGGGYKERNLLIARDSDEVHVVVVRSLPNDYVGMIFPRCYHCNTASHVKSGACWTAREAQQLGKNAFWHVVEN